MRRWSRFLGGCAPIFAAALLIVTPALGQENDTGWKAPHKAGHTFSPVSGIPDAFVRSYVRMALGVSQTAETEFPLGIIDGDTLFASTGNLVFTQIALEYQQTIKEWIAFRAQFGLLGRLGTGTTALLSSGVSASVGYDLGWLVRLNESRKGYLSASVDVRNTDFTTINIAEFVNNIIEGEDAELVQTTPSMRAGVGLRYTYAFSPLFGVVAFGETGFGEPVDESDGDEWFWRFGATADFDLGAAGWLPIGLALGYLQDSFPEGGTDLTDVLRTFVFRVGYIGRKDLALGLSASYSIFPTEDLDRDLKSVGGQFEIRYYF
jgi:hypothetical protein